jgi:histidinol-phosphate phosphatase family protein
MIFTNDRSRTIQTVRLLVVVDRDGTIIRNDEFVGRINTWKRELALNTHVVRLLSFIKKHYRTTIIVASNQSGVARRYFSEQTVRSINSEIAKLLLRYGIRIHSWQYCPDVDTTYARKYPEVSWDRRYVKKVTQRKPSSGMVHTALEKLHKRYSDYDAVLVMGDHKDDEGLAKTLSASYISVKNKGYRSLLSEFKTIKFSMDRMRMGIDA